LVLAANVALSKKKAGRYEEIVIQKLIPYFIGKGYEVVPHSRLNIAWGPIISDIDVLLIKDGLLTCVEVKSCKDKISRAPEQINQIKDFVDYAYVATEKAVQNWSTENVGLILVNGNTIKVMKKARKFSKKPTFLSILCLKKSCLNRMLTSDFTNFQHIDKFDLAKKVYSKRGSKCTRKYIREIVTCGENCSVCPIDDYNKQLSVKTPKL
jgi:hypothetical protein